MTKGRICRNYVSKPKDVCLTSLKDKLKSMIILEEIPNTHNIAFKNDFRVDLQYLVF